MGLRHTLPPGPIAPVRPPSISSTRPVFFGLAVLFTSLLACDATLLRPAEASLRLSERSIDFGETGLGREEVRVLEVHNDGRALLRVRLALASAVFAIEPRELTVPGGGTERVRITFRPELTGAAEATLEVWTGELQQVVVLKGTGISADPCRDRPDGASCSLACLEEDAVCRDGRCTGAPRTCDDGNPCTLDACDPQGGCTNLETIEVCPSPESPCLVPVCDRESGCGIVDAQDGTACGPADCQQAHVCISGACVVRAVPEGASCGEESICQPRGVCRNGVCERPEPSLRPAWYGEPDLLEDARLLLADASGTVFVVPEYLRTGLHALTATGQPLFSRPDIGGTGFMIQGSALLFAGEGEIRAVSPATGADLWTLPLRSALGAFVAAGGEAPEELHVGWMASAGPDSVWVAFGGVGRPPGETSPRGVLWLLRLRHDTGKVLFLNELAEGVGSPAIDEQGRIFVLTGDHNRPRVGELDPHTGHVLWSLPVVGFSRPMSAASGNVAVYGFETGLYGSGRQWWSLPLQARWSDGWHSFNFFSSVTDGQTLFLDAVERETPERARRLFAIDVATGAVRGYSDPANAFSQPLLTTSGTVLTIARRNYSHELVEFDADGREILRCPLPHSRRTALDPVLTGEWLVLGEDASSGPPRLVGYPLPGRREAQSGWTNGHGNSQRTRRAR